MKILKRNQIIVSVIAVMLITVGYMNFTSDLTKSSIETAELINTENVANIGDAKLVNSDEVVDETELDGISETVGENTVNEIVSNEDNQSKEENNVNNKTTQTTSNTVQISDEYFTLSKIERDKIYSQMLESYEGILKNEYVSAEQKDNTTKEITTLNNKKNAIMITENLIKNLGFTDVVVFVNEDSINVIIKAEKLEEADVAKIQNIVCRELNVEVEKIHITLK